MNVSSGNLCEDCLNIVQQDGCICIEVRDGETGNNPYRTGRLVGVTKQVKDMLEIKTHACFMPQSVFSKIFEEQIKEVEHEAN